MHAVLLLLATLTVQPYFFSVDVSGHFTGYEAQVQVRPGISSYVWPGGYLSDGTFVQNGIVTPGPGWATHPIAFVWATRADGDRVKLSYIDLPESDMGRFYTFRLVQSGSRWTFSYTDPRGATVVQGSFVDKAYLNSVTATSEAWMTGFGPFSTQVFRRFRVKTSAGWVTPTATVSFRNAGGQDYCASMVSRTRGSVVISYSPTAVCGWRKLW